MIEFGKYIYILVYDILKNSPLPSNMLIFFNLVREIDDKDAAPWQLVGQDMLQSSHQIMGLCILFMYLLNRDLRIPSLWKLEIFINTFRVIFCKKIPLSRHVGYVMDGSMDE